MTEEKMRRLPNLIGPLFDKFTTWWESQSDADYYQSSPYDYALEAFWEGATARAALSTKQEGDAAFIEAKVILQSWVNAEQDMASEDPPEDIRAIQDRAEECFRLARDFLKRIGPVTPDEARQFRTLSIKQEAGPPIDRETLGRMVREAWVRWALTQPNPKPSWLLPYDELSEPDKEADRQIGEAICKWTVIHYEARATLTKQEAGEVSRSQSAQALEEAARLAEKFALASYEHTCFVEFNELAKALRALSLPAPPVGDGK